MNTRRLLSAALLLIAYESVYPCDCYLGESQEKLERAQIVFYGRLDLLEYKGSLNFVNEKEVIATFTVLKSWKGEVSKVTLDTVLNASSCSGYWFEEKQNYLVYTYFVKNKLDTYYCGGVYPEKETEYFNKEIDALNKLSN